MKTQKVLELCASHLADVVGGVLAAHVVPLVVPGQDHDVVDYNHEYDHDVDNHA